MKKIVFVIESLHCGGAEKSLTTLLNHIDYAKHSVELILFKHGGEFEKFVPNEVTVTWINPFENINKLKLTFLRIKFLLFRKLKKKNEYHNAQCYWKVFGNHISQNIRVFDLAIAYNQGFATYYVADNINAENKIAWLNTDYQKAGYNAVFDYSKYSQYNNVVCVSKENELSFITAMEKIGKKFSITIIKDIIDINTIKELSNKPGSFDNQNTKELKILTVGRLAKAKGFHLAIDACSLLVNNNIKLKWYVIGEGAERNFLESKIKEKHLENQFILLGYKENPYPYIKSCDIYVQTSLFEGLGLTVIEAAVLEKPIVTTNFPTAFSIITHNETGLITTMDAKSISESILYYIKNPSFTQSIIKNLSKQKSKDLENSLKLFYNLVNDIT
ncbi:hypothetical protein BFR04_08865 [Gaetbulibacter sp. 4G1]|nr:glycosyltransferase [Gaetbulibacter sp. 4G1]PIA77540.1 hypothetical protein BFR04_08865 [Gaetbulibacter sp. 4G1]